MRNLEKDAVEMAQRRERMLKAGFDLFSTRAIEPVTMLQVANACDVGVATLYRYFPTKADLVIAISAEKWKEVYADLIMLEKEKDIRSKTAAEQYEFYLDCFIYMYKNYRAMLRFNYDFNFYIANVGVTREQLRPNSEAAIAFAQNFHGVWEAAQKDGTLKLGTSERDLFSSSMHIMLAVATRYAAGLIYHAGTPEEDVKELEALKQMILEANVIKK